MFFATCAVRCTLQRTALRIIFGTKKSYSKLFDLPTNVCREELENTMEKIAMKLKSSQRFSDSWLPTKKSKDFEIKF